MKPMVLLLACVAASAVVQAPDAQAQSAQEGVRTACAPDVERFCPAAAGNPFRMRSCILENQANVQPRCRNALVAAGQIPAPTGPPTERR